MGFDRRDRKGCYHDQLVPVFIVARAVTCGSDAMLVKQTQPGQPLKSIVGFWTAPLLDCAGQLSLDLCDHVDAVHGVAFGPRQSGHQ